MSPKTLLWPHLDGVSILGFPSVPTCWDLTPISTVTAKPKLLQSHRGGSAAADAGVRGVDEALPSWPASQQGCWVGF